MQIESIIGVILIITCIWFSTALLVGISMLIGDAVADLIDIIKDWRRRNRK